jgi:magnesium chelatase subunit D
MVPSAEPEVDSPPPPPPPDSAPADDEQAEAPADPMQSLQEMAVAAARAAIPPGLLARLAAGQSLRRSTASAGDAGASRNDARRGRPIGSRAGELRTGARLDIVETLRAAAPWQALRRTAAAARTDMGPTEMGPRPRIIVRPEDFRIARFRRQTGDRDLRRRCVRLVGDAPAGRSQGRRRDAAGGLLCAARPGGADRLPRA